MKTLALVISLFIISTSSHAREVNDGVSTLSPELQQLFSKEMVQLKQGMNEIMDAYLTGRWDDIVLIAKKMENSYVLRQGLTKNQMHELHSKLPEGFLKLDEQFHYYSGMLAHASKSKKPELIAFYLSKTSETCVSCHSVYATNKFPSFKSKDETDDHHH